jgi:predicted dehydrogenase
MDMETALTPSPLSHAGAYTRHGGFELAACVDSDQSKRNDFAKFWRIAEQASDISELGAQSGSFDVISICSPTHVHHIHLEQAIDLRPRLIFCEKPLTADLSSADYTVKKCESSNIKLIVNYGRCWDSSVADVITQLRGGRWGQIRSVIGHYNKGILNNGGHLVDLLLRLLGPLSLVATASQLFDFWEYDPTIAALLTAKEGTVPVYLNPGHARDFAYFELEIVCELGVIRMESGGINWQFRGVVPSSQYPGYRTLEIARYVEGSYLKSMERAIADLYAYLQDGTPVVSTGEEALKVQSLCTQIQLEALVNSSTPNKRLAEFDE